MMDVCLHGLHNALLAKVIFEELWVVKQAEQLLNTCTYSTFINACITLSFNCAPRL